MLNDVILGLLLQLPECIAYSLSNNGIKPLAYWGNQSFTLVASYSDFQVFSEWCVRYVLVWNEDDDILTDIGQCILGVVVTGIE